MIQEKYKQYLAVLKNNPSSDSKAYLHVITFFIFLFLGIILSIKNSLALFVLGQTCMLISLVLGQVLTHELGHNHFFKTKILNKIFGELISLSPILPYGPWCLIHSKHHAFGGNKYKDPTFVDKEYSDLNDKQKKVINFAWKYWIPILSLSYSLSNFWNISKLKKLFPDHGSKIYFSIFFTIIFYLFLILKFKFLFLKIWAPSYYLFLALTEPLLLAQHVHVDQGDTIDKDFNVNKTYHVREQDQFSRTLILPKFISKWLLIGFNEHATHHVFPNLPGYHFHLINENYNHTISLLKWYKESKKIEGSKLLFQTSSQTGLLVDL